jgi:hypothetical protein
MATMPSSTRLRAARTAVLAALLVASLAHGVEAAEQSEEDLAKKTQNPVADLISVPFQNNFNFGTGPEDRMVWVMNVQPVIPLRLTESWNLISRIIMPIVNQPSLAPGLAHAFGLGDLNPTFFFSPSKPSPLIWGVGPTLTLPTATEPQLGLGRWSAGPAAVVLVMHGPWVVGALGNNQWSFAGWGDTTVNAFLLQPFLNYNFKKGWYLTSAPIMTSNWRAASGNRWTVPVGGGGGKLVKLGKLPLNTQLSVFYNAVRPDQVADVQVRFQLQFLFPK